MTFIDRLIQLFAPRLALERHVAQTRMRLLTDGVRKYEGAAKTDRLKLWNASDSSVNTEVKDGAKLLRKRARDLRRNNPYAARAVQVITSNTVGTGIKPSIHGQNQRLLKTAEMKWKAWAEASNACDYDGRNNIYGLQAVVMDAVAESGECYIIRHRRSASVGQVPLQLQVLEADYLDNNHKEDLPNRNKIRQGIEYDPTGRRLAYHFFRHHPGDNEQFLQEKIRVPASRVLHCYKQSRPGQARGVTFLHPVMIRLRELDVFQDASLRKQQVAACFSAFLYNATGDSLDTIDTPKSEYELLEKLDTGTIQELPPGFDIKFASPPSIDFYADFVKQELMAIAAGLGITYEAMTQDYGNVNFSSGRMGFLEFQRNIKRWQDEILIGQFMSPLFDWFLDALQFATPTDMNAMNLEASWTVPAREMIDPSKEVPANRDAVRAGFKTLSEVLRQQGYNPKEVFQERLLETQMIKEMGLKFDTDVMTAVAKPAGEVNADNEDEEDSDEDPGAE